MADTITIELLLDAAFEALVRSDWARLGAAGHSSMSGYASASHRPHVTLLVRPTQENPLPASLFRAAARRLPIEVELAEPIFFAHGARGVLARRVVPSPELRALHAAVHASAPPGSDAPHTAANEWTPHVTLARRLRRESLVEAMALLGPPHAGTGVALRRWDSAARVVTPIPGGER